jgi:hypothetical protein
MINLLIIAPMLYLFSHKKCKNMIAFFTATFIFTPEETENTVNKIFMTFIKGYDKQTIV